MKKISTITFKKNFDFNTRSKKGILRSLFDFWKPLLIQGTHSPECYNQFKIFQKAFNKLSESLDLEEHQKKLNEIELVLPKGIGNLNDLFNLNNRRQKEDFYEYNGSYYDDFDIEVLEKLNDLNFNLDINNLKKKFGILPISVELALIIERLIAPYINDYKFYKKYNDLYEDIEDDNSFDLAYRCKIK